MLFVNLLTAALGAATLTGYVLVYTPLKTRTTLCTLIGAFPGAAPPIMGWTAARGEIDAIGLSLFAILFLWQMPHFFAIAWIFTEDYTRAGFSMHTSGERTGRQIIFYCCALIPISVLPTFFGLTGMMYLMARFCSDSFISATVSPSHFFGPTPTHAGCCDFLSCIYRLSSS
jgi:protoheme IX farnesyltransferase